MELNKNAVAAISAAIQLYLEGEQVLAAAPVEMQKPIGAPRPPFSPWALSGRQAAMDMRRLWQMRLVR
ncbi:MAG: hypothetical protein AB9873_01460 [Syntrophobacteraceae bacterium]